MPRKLRVEVEVGLYHLITRGNDRQDVFHAKARRYAGTKKQYEENIAESQD